MNDQIVIDGVTYIRKGLDLKHFTLSTYAGNGLYLSYKGQCILRLDLEDPNLAVHFSDWFDKVVTDDVYGLIIRCKGIPA